MPRYTLAILRLLAVMCTVGCQPLTVTVGAGPPKQRIETTTVLADDGFWVRDEIALIDVSGFLANASRRGVLAVGENPVDRLHQDLNHAARHDRVKAVVLRINSPGGTVTASDMMLREVERFKARTGKPVLALITDVGASGGYLLACGADRIMVHPTSITGSIGVIVQLVSVKGTLEWVGMEPIALTSGPNKDAGSPLSELTDEHRAVLQRMVDQFYDRFVSVVVEARPGLSRETTPEVFDGRVVTGDDAVTRGLADEVGDIYAAFDAAKSMANVDHAKLVRLHRPGQDVKSPHAAAPVSEGWMPHLPTAWPAMDPAAGAPSFLYHWSYQSGAP